MPLGKEFSLNIADFFRRKNVKMKKKLRFFISRKNDRTRRYGYWKNTLWCFIPPGYPRYGSVQGRR